MAQDVDRWMNTLTEDAQTISEDSLDLAGAQYPWIQWVNGDKKLKAAGGALYTGGWFCPADNMFESEPEGWTRGTLTHDNGDETEGWFAQRLTLIPIRSRRCWRVQDAAGVSQFFSWDRYDEAKAVGSPRGKLQVLCLVKGLGDEPMVLTLSGMAGKAFAPGGREASVMNVMRHCIIDPINASLRKAKSKAKMTWRCFWLQAGAPEGEPVFVTVGTGQNTSIVTPPQAIGLRPKMTMQEIYPFYIGREKLDLVNQLYADAEQWANAWEQAAGEPEAATEPVVANVEDADLPF